MTARIAPVPVMGFGAFWEDLVPEERHRLLQLTFLAKHEHGRPLKFPFSILLTQKWSTKTWKCPKKRIAFTVIV